MDTPLECTGCWARGFTKAWNSCILSSLLHLVVVRLEMFDAPKHWSFEILSSWLDLSLPDWWPVWPMFSLDPIGWSQWEKMRSGCDSQSCVGSLHGQTWWRCSLDILLVEIFALQFLFLIPNKWIIHSHDCTPKCSERDVETNTSRTPLESQTVTLIPRPDPTEASWTELVIFALGRPRCY